MDLEKHLMTEEKVNEVMNFDMWPDKPDTKPSLGSSITPMPNGSEVQIRNGKSAFMGTVVKQSSTHITIKVK